MKVANFSFCIPSKGRAERLKIFFDKYYNPDYHYFIALEKEDIPAYKLASAVYREPNVDIVQLKESNQGIGYSRNQLAKASLARGDKVTFFIDDNSDYRKIKLDEFINVVARNKKVLWCGGFANLYDLFYPKGKGKKLFTAQCPCVAFAVKTEILKDINFDRKITNGEDADFIAHMRMRYDTMPYVYRPFRISKRRHEAGGGTNFKTKEKIQANCNYMNKKFGVV